MQSEQLDTGVRRHANLASSDASRDRARRSLPTNRMSFFRHGMIAESVHAAQLTPHGNLHKWNFTWSRRNDD